MSKHKLLKSWKLSMVGLSISALLLCSGCSHSNILEFLKKCDILGLFAKQEPLPPPPQAADETRAEFLLRNLALAEKIASAKIGGNGTAKFTNDPQKLRPFASARAIDAIETASKAATIHGGYKVTIQENPVGDAFKTDFLLIASPAEGFSGKTFQVSKDQKITIVGE